MAKTPTLEQAALQDHLGNIADRKARQPGLLTKLIKFFKLDKVTNVAITALGAYAMAYIAKVVARAAYELTQSAVAKFAMEKFDKLWDKIKELGEGAGNFFKGAMSMVPPAMEEAGDIIANTGAKPAADAAKDPAGAKAPDEAPPGPADAKEGASEKPEEKKGPAAKPAEDAPEDKVAAVSPTAARGGGPLLKAAANVTPDQGADKPQQAGAAVVAGQTGAQQTKRPVFEFIG
jgi:hypothetical protein